MFAGQTHSIIVEKERRDAAIHAFSERHLPKFGESEDGAHHLRAWAAANAAVQGFWWPPGVLTSAKVDRREIEQAEIRVLDYLLGWRSILPMYRAIFDFDLEAALRRVEAPTLVLEFLTREEAHLGPQAEKICRLMKHARPGRLEQADGLAPELRPADVVDAILPFLES